MHAEASQIVALGVPVIAHAEIDVVDPGGIDAGAFDRGVDHMGRQDRGFSVVERAPVGLADPGARS